MKKCLWVLLGVIAFLGGGFWYLNFRIADSNTQSEKNIYTTGMGIDEGLPDSMQGREKINLVLVGEDPWINALQKALTEEMKDAGIADLELVQGSEPSYPSPALIVKVERTRLVWTPFFATSQITIQTGYSSSGDATFMGKTPVTLDSRKGPVLVMYGEYKVSDRSWGLISRPGYHQALAEYSARQIISTLKEIYRVSTGKFLENPRGFLGGIDGRCLE